jgi:YegS/Rv2252/BmrU family lipid kinase
LPVSRNRAAKVYGESGRRAITILVKAIFLIKITLINPSVIIYGAPVFNKHRGFINYLFKTKKVVIIILQYGLQRIPEKRNRVKHLFIINPVAGKCKTLKLIPKIETYFKDNPNEYSIEITKYPGHATEIALDYASRGNFRIYSVGGDGTLNEVLNGMVASACSLAVIPSGSGNDFMKSIIDENDPLKLLGRTIHGKDRYIDIAKVNDRYFINIASLGFDAQVAQNTEKYKKLPLISGKMAYMLGIMATIMACKNHLTKIKVDDYQFESRTLLTAVGIGRFYGGGMMALPKAVIDDGLFDICHVEGMDRTSILRLFPKYMKGRHESIKKVHFYKGRRVEITPDGPIAMNVDGEVSMVDKAVFEIIPAGLKFVFPI